MIVIDVEQGTPEWLRARMGIPTASKFSSIMTPKTRKMSASGNKYMFAVIAERVFGCPVEDATTEFMARGTLLEQAAVTSYELENDVETVKVGFVLEDGRRYGCSPDRFVGEDGLLETKCPAAATHIGALLGYADDEYFSQCQGQLLVTGRKWVDLMYYNPALPRRVVRIVRDEEYLSDLASALDLFCANLDDHHARLLSENPEMAGSAQGWAQGTEARSA